jgi:hydrogenase maturation protein HypF
VIGRCGVEVEGIVQGVGFRPYVYGLASRHHLHGFVRNRTGGVQIEVEGEPDYLKRFLDELATNPPPLAQIDRLRFVDLPPRGDIGFSIEASEEDHSPNSVLFSPDIAVCYDCLAELFDPANRRYRYPFLNCTNCGPRLTIIEGSPYDRPRTTMAGFPMCRECRAEYEDPANRRFHAQPTACEQCGPRLQFLDAKGAPKETSDPLAAFEDRIRTGRIGAMKGLGGYHLVCDARNESAVAELRRRKHREEKPLAVMVRDTTAVEALCNVSRLERQLLELPRCPIVLLAKRVGCDVAESVAPNNPLLGVMLPYTPLHHLLLRDLDSMALVMTSGNRSEEPIAYEEVDAVERLHGIADVFLVHDRPIHVRCDDSVTRVVDGRELPIRRSRGYAPQPVPLPVTCRRPILAVGGQFKATFALGRERQAIVSHHMGDLDNYSAYSAFRRDIGLYEDLFSLRPQIIAHDRHPDYASTHYAMERAAADGLPLVPVQHHHAHMASCMAEHRLTGEVIGVTFDGTGYGDDGAIWGGEFLVGDYCEFRRAAHLRYVALPGGDRAVREPWRMALASALDAGCDVPTSEAAASPTEFRTVTAMIERRLNAPLTSSAGRLFDAVASLAGVRHQVRFEGQAAMELERLAWQECPQGLYEFDLACDGDSPLVIDTRPLIRAVASDVAQGVDAPRIARRFHDTLVEVIVVVCGEIRKQCGLDRVVLSGGVFMNALLTLRATARLSEAGFQVYRHETVPPNDGGLSLGQVAVTAARIAEVNPIEEK